MTARSSLCASAACTLALFAATGASAQQSANQGPLTYLGKSATTVVMASDLGALDGSSQRTIWVWHFFGPDHERSTPGAPYTRAVRTTVDCSDRTTINRATEHLAGSTFSSRLNLSDVATWSRVTENTLGALPVKALCDPAPVVPRATYPNVAAARANADLRLKPPPAAAP
ncbi:MAG: hypothetical protein ACT6RD_09185 [Brevundimonas sp.]|uniref:hypothetical protein n=1 Tax=Brevundimonas sp. TaxID=1871086 RepID=UPI0040333203